MRNNGGIWKVSTVHSLTGGIDEAGIKTKQGVHADHRLIFEEVAFWEEIKVHANSRV